MTVPFIYLNTTLIAEQAVDRRFTATDFRVRDYLLCNVSIGNYIHISQTEAAKYLKIARPNISASIKKLISLGVILQGPDTGKFKTYQINPALARFRNV
jgi:DNA-binding MarR family transcriptional regulator